jgi:tRNA threonylcarbamoyladenosine biosynthesis protein TsaB
LLTLAFDTSTTTGLVVLLRDKAVLSSKLWNREGSHGEFLTPALNECLDLANLRPTDIDQIAVGIGPGSFTGARISVNAAKALAYTLSKPILTYDTTELLAAGVSLFERPLLVMLNANKNQIYASTYIWNSHVWHRKSLLNCYHLESLDSLILTEHLCLGDGFEEYQAFLPPKAASFLVRDLRATNATSDTPSVASFQNLDRLGSRQPLVWKDIQALYVRASGAEEKRQEDLNKKV